MQKLRNLRSRLSLVVGLACVSAVVLAQSAFAAANADTVDAVTSSTTTLTDTIKAAIPLILAVTVFMVIIGLGKRLLRKAG